MRQDAGDVVGPRYSVAERNEKIRNKKQKIRNKEVEEGEGDWYDFRNHQFCFSTLVTCMILIS